MKKLVSLFLCILLVMSQCAFAGTNKTIVHGTYDDNFQVEAAFAEENTVWYQINNYGGMNSSYSLVSYDILTGETNEYSMPDLYANETYGLENGIVAYIDDEDDEDEDEDDEDEDEEQNYANTYAQYCMAFPYQGKLHIVVTINTYKDDTNTVDGGYVYMVEPNGDKADVVESDIPKLDFEYMIEDSYGYCYAKNPFGCSVAGDTLYCLTYDNDYNSIIVKFDLTDGSTEYCSVDGGETITAIDDDNVIVTAMYWNDSAAKYDVEITKLNVETGEGESLAKIAEIDYENVPRNMCVSGDRLYYVSGAHICYVENYDFMNPVEVNSVNINNGRDAMLTADNSIMISDYQNVLVRSLDVSDRAESILRICDNAYTEAVENAYYPFTDENPGVEVILDQNVDIDILQDMLTRSSEYDIFTATVSSSVYNALYERGFLAELDSSEKINAMFDKIYDCYKPAMMKDGHIYAIPMSMYGYGMGINMEIAEKMGYSEEDLPKTWSELFDFIDAHADDFIGTKYRMFDMYTYRESLHNNLVEVVMQAYQNYINGGNAEYAFNTPMLRELLTRIDSIDYDALELMEESDMENGIMMMNDEWRECLINTYIDYGVQQGDYYMHTQPLILGFEDEPAQLPVTMTVMFVNPYSENKDLAIRYLEIAADNISEVYKYDFFNDYNEPKRYPGYEEYKEELNKWLEEAKKNYEEAEDEDEKDMWAESVEQYQKELDQVDESYWEYSEKGIQLYNERVKVIKPVLYDSLTLVDEDGNSIYNIIWGYMEGTISMDDMLSQIDKKVQMIRLEGN